jgi:hypothetical protein
VGGGGRMFHHQNLFNQFFINLETGGGGGLQEKLQIAKFMSECTSDLFVYLFIY